ncbi:GNAT family N-acetyltransferase [Fluviicola sp.]|uniref:GNAT family N-acetyltransferase n=1 Tax=Fluviicola sp. TaxID=1917219 RepID=UPI00281C3A27|nr:GNAT family N-acetyltransferase [Fluviicola sp.]MDR0801815.1 GNAT family N-acetyltransferase [Fluviicola sp.]
MKFPETYRCLSISRFNNGVYSLVPIRYEDRKSIMKWRNEQIYHLRQNRPLTESNQDHYFQNVVKRLFTDEQPDQILFSFLENDVCIGYGGLVHINWTDKNAEISFIMNTESEAHSFQKYWSLYLDLIERAATENLGLHKLFTFAFDLRPHLYQVLESSGYIKEAILKEHCFFDGQFIDVVIHSKFLTSTHLLPVTENDVELLFKWANDPAVRMNSFHPDPIFWDKHQEWFLSKLNSATTKFYILYHNKIPAGQIRLELADEVWEINYSIASEFRGKGLGKRIIELICLEMPSGSSLRGLVKNDNPASLKVFLQSDFEKESDSSASTSRFIKKIG